MFNKWEITSGYNWRLNAKGYPNGRVDGQCMHRRSE